MDRKIERKQFLIPTRYWLWIAAAAVFLGLIVWLAAGSYTTVMKVDRADLHIRPVAKGEFNDYIALDAHVAPIQVVQISPEEGGIVQERVVEEGARVRKGDVLVRLSNANLNLQILNAESELAEKQNMLRNTQISMEQDRLNNSYEELQLSQDVVAKRRHWMRQEKLFAERLIPQEDWLRAREDYELAVKKHQLVRERLHKDSLLRQSQTEQMEDNLAAMQRNVLLVRERKERLEVRAQIDGEVGLLDVELGQSVAAGGKIGVVNDLSDFKVEAMVDEHYIDRVVSGLTARFQQGGSVFGLRLRKVFPEVRNGRFRVDFTFDGNKPANIRTGQTYYIDLELGEPKQAVIIPKGTFYSATGGNWIFVLDKEGKKAYRRQIRIGRQNPEHYEVTEGLEPGEQVIVSGYEAFKEMETIVIKD